MLINRYRIHKWLAVTVGVILTVWTVSGLVMILPQPEPDALVSKDREPIDYSQLLISPAEGVAKARGGDASLIGAGVKGVALVRVRNAIVYRVTFENGGIHLVDAVAGTPVNITPELAKQIALDGMRPDVGEVNVALLEERPIGYPWGPLPVYRLEFENADGAIAYVDARDGTVSFTNLARQVWGGIALLHEFFPLAFAFSEPVREGALLIATLALVLVIVTGYFIALAPRSRKVRKLQKEG